MSRREVRTATPENSIWLEISQDTFRQHLVVLEERTNAVPIDAQAFHASDWQDNQTSHVGNLRYTLPIEVEQQLSDDFACLVAVEEGAQSVAAVCVEERQSPSPGLTLRFAALDTTLDEGVRTALLGFSTMLSEAAVASTRHQVDSHVDSLSRCIVRLHSRRLVARLRCSRWEKPKHLVRSHKKALWRDFPILIHRAQFVYSRKEKTVRRNVEDDLSGLAVLYEAFDNIEVTGSPEEGEEEKEESLMLHQLVKSSFSLCSKQRMRDFIARIENSAGTKMTSQISAALKCFRQVEKIGAYYRISTSLMETARRYPTLFTRGINLAYLTPYTSLATTIGYESWATTCHVHAEVQLAIHYDTTAPRLPNSTRNTAHFLQPRCIGISKWLCYLCYQFLKAHGDFFPSKTHGRLYDQWTIPDLAEFDDELVRKYRAIVGEIDAVVVGQTVREPELWRVEPMTSRQDLAYDGLVVVVARHDEVVADDGVVESFSKLDMQGSKSG